MKPKTLLMLDGTEYIDKAKNVTVKDFWSWAYSDLLVNTNRSVLAEFLVATALEVANEPRIEWDYVDLRYRGHIIEVKTSAYVQSWPQVKLSKIVFDIAKKQGWDASTNTEKPTKGRYSDCYVFCLFTEQDSQQANILDLNKWAFYVVNTEIINKEFREQKSVTLNTIKKLVDPVTYGNLKRTVDDVLQVN